MAGGLRSRDSPLSSPTAVAFTCPLPAQARICPNFCDLEMARHRDPSGRLYFASISSWPTASSSPAGS